MKNKIHFILLNALFVIPASLMIYDGIQKGTDWKLVIMGIFLISIVFLLHFYSRYQANQLYQVLSPQEDNYLKGDKISPKFPRRFDFPKQNFYWALLGFILFAGSFVMLVFVFKWPDLFEKLFKYRQLGVLFMFTIVTGFFLFMFHRDQTGFISYDTTQFQIKNKFFLGKNFTALWTDLKEIVLQESNSSANIIFQFNKKFVAVTDSSQEYKNYIIYLVQYLDTTAQSSKIRSEIVTNSIGPGVSPNIKINKKNYLNWLKK